MSKLFQKYFGMCYTGGRQTMGLGIHLSNIATGNAVTRRMAYTPRLSTPRYVRSRVMRYGSSIS